MKWKTLDSQMREYKEELRENVKLTEMATLKLATTISSEVRFLPHEQKEMLRHAGPVKFEKRYEELVAFNTFHEQDVGVKSSNRPSVGSEHVYLSELHRIHISTGSLFSYSEAGDAG